MSKVRGSSREELLYVRGWGGCWEELLHVQGKEQQLHYAGATVKRYSTSKVRETQVREGIRGQTDGNHNHRQLANLITWTTAFSNSMILSHALMMLWKCCTQYASKFGKLSSGHRTQKGQFSTQSQRKAMPKNAQTTAQLHSSHTLVKSCSKFSKPGFSNMWTVNFLMYPAARCPLHQESDHYTTD